MIRLRYTRRGWFGLLFLLPDPWGGQKQVWAGPFVDADRARKAVSFEKPKMVPFW